jgi:hypothetical protein
VFIEASSATHRAQVREVLIVGLFAVAGLLDEPVFP